MSTQDDNVYATVLRSPVSCEIARDRVIFRLTGGASLRRKAVAEAEKPNQFPWTESCPARPFNQRASPACAQTPHPRPASSRPGNPRPEPPAAARSPSPGEFLGTARLVPPAPESAPEPQKTEPGRPEDGSRDCARQSLPGSGCRFVRFREATALPDSNRPSYLFPPAIFPCNLSIGGELGNFNAASSFFHDPSILHTYVVLSAEVTEPLSARSRV